MDVTMRLDIGLFCFSCSSRQWERGGEGRLSAVMRNRYCCRPLLRQRQRSRANTLSPVAVNSGGSKNFEMGGERKRIYQLRPHLSQMRTTKYMPFTRKKRLFEKKYEPIWAVAPTTALWIRHWLPISWQLKHGGDSARLRTVAVKHWRQWLLVSKKCKINVISSEYYVMSILASI